MDQEDFEKFARGKKDSVFILSTPIPIPLHFMDHTYIVTVKKGKINRYEVWNSTDVLKKTGGGWSTKNVSKKNWGYLQLNLFDPYIGGNRYFFMHNPRSGIKLLGKVEGVRAKKIISFIEKNVGKYPYKQKYKNLGPNCNTFTQWILDNFPDINIRLPWTAIGKNYKLKN